MEIVNSWSVILKQYDDVKNNIKLLELEQDYVLLSLNEAIEQNNIDEKNKLIERLQEIGVDIVSNKIKIDGLRKEYDRIKSTTKPKMV